MFDGGTSALPEALLAGCAYALMKDPIPGGTCTTLESPAPIGVSAPSSLMLPMSFTPSIDSDEEEPNLYPVMEIGLYDRALFQRLRSYDTLISGEFYQALDFGVRCYLLGYRIFTSRALALQFPKRLSIIEDRSLCDGSDRFYTKAMSIRRIAGKNVIEKWKPYVDKEVLNDEVKKKQMIMQKTDFFTIMKNWKIGRTAEADE